MALLVSRRDALDGYQSLHAGHGYAPPGVGAVAAGVVGGAALGFAGGMVADEVFDSFGDDEGGDEEG
ncbi:hypothetical protein GA0070618_2262 [Micromonospora echinospora]|uniref:Uncharacterized protein n=1 Tax=Micromonospora echinospora TaxID=1877 RepID=A0A1C4WJY9_MICEC|nr:hypothetical protein [Micromonospora echinospora]SCE96484.1 hypothetical protein GA0070618_2262 [Micromonospora echinospora]